MQALVRHSAHQRPAIPLLFFLTRQPPPASTLFPYTTLFRSRRRKRKIIYRAQRQKRRTRPRNERPLFGDERSEEHTSELQSPYDLVCRLLLEKKNKNVL